MVSKITQVGPIFLLYTLAPKGVPGDFASFRSHCHMVEFEGMSIVSNDGLVVMYMRV